MKSFFSLSKYAKRHPTLGYPEPSSGGFFEVHCVQSGRTLRIIASWSDGWDHVSVSLPNRTPNWQEMDFVKRTFFNADEVAYQIHPEEKDHINIHPHCLHLWRCQTREIPLPPKNMIG